MSIAEQILARIFALLLGATSAGASVFRAREIPIARAEAPALLIFANNQTSATFAEHAERNELEVYIVVCTRGDVSEALADAVATQVHPLLANDATLQTLAQDMSREGDEWQAKEADETAGERTMKYIFTYLSDSADITRFPIG